MTARNVAASVFLALGTGLAQAQDASACKGERWSVPRELRTHAGNTVFLEQPSVVSIRDGVFLPAWPTRVYDSAGAVVWPLAPGGKPSSVEHVPAGAVVGTDGVARLVPWPNGLQAGPWRPVATADDSGVAHVIWGSRDNEPVSSLYMVRSLWHARFDGTGWGRPTRVLTTEGTVIWSSAATSPLLARGRSLHLLAAIQGEGLRYVRFDGGVWSDRHVDIPTVYIGY